MIVTFFFTNNFKKGHSTDHAVIKLIDKVYDSFNQNKYTLGVFIDL